MSFDSYQCFTWPFAWYFCSLVFDRSTTFRRLSTFAFSFPWKFRRLFCPFDSTSFRQLTTLLLCFLAIFADYSSDLPRQSFDNYQLCLVTSWVSAFSRFRFDEDSTIFFTIKSTTSFNQDFVLLFPLYSLPTPVDATKDFSTILETSFDTLIIIFSLRSYLSIFIPDSSIQQWLKNTTYFDFNFLWYFYPPFFIQKFDMTMIWQYLDRSLILVVINMW